MQLGIQRPLSPGELGNQGAIHPLAPLESALEPDEVGGIAEPGEHGDDGHTRQRSRENQDERERAHHSGLWVIEKYQRLPLRHDHLEGGMGRRINRGSRQVAHALDGHLR